jgi:uncharacterized protein (DUF697 family)
MANQEVKTSEQAPVATESVGMSAREAEANIVVRNHMLGAMAVGLIPVPAVDLVGIAAVNLKMLHGLSKTYELPFTNDLGKSVLASLSSAVGAELASRLLTAGVTKLFPGIGSLIGAVAMPISAGATTYAVGKIFIQHFESGGTLLTFDAAKIREFFKAKYKEGVALATQLKSEQPKVKSA